MENKIIEKILEDIYLIDEDLRKNEKQLIKIINELLISKPDTKFDDNFSVMLRSEVLKKIEAIEKESKLKNEKIFNIINLNFMKKSYYIVGGVFTFALLLVLVFSFYPKNRTNLSQSLDKLDLKSNIARVDNNAFGQFLTSERSSGANPDLSIGTVTEMATVGLGGGGRIAPMASSKMMLGIYPPEYTKYNYVYKGDDFEIPSEADVYKKIVKDGIGKNLAQKLNIDFGMLDLNKFKNIELTNFNITENQDFGYTVYFNLLENLVSINMDWEKWPQPDRGCTDEACFQKFRLKISDVPNDSELIAIADQAIAEYGIDMSAFGEARINNSWRQSYDMTDDKTSAYIPDTINVLYPLKIQGVEVHDDYNNGAGINVDVNIRYKKMSGIRGISINDYQASSYSLEQDQKRILKFVEQGGLYPGYMPLGTTEEENIEIGTPILGLIINWKYDNNGRGDEYYIPALIFPIINKGNTAFYSRESISIPLLKELLDQAENENLIAPEPYLMRSPDSSMTNGVEVQTIEGVETPMIAPEAMIK